MCGRNNFIVVPRGGKLGFQRELSVISINVKTSSDFQRLSTGVFRDRDIDRKTPTQVCRKSKM